MWFIGVELEQETSAPPPKKNPGSAPVLGNYNIWKYTILSHCRHLKVEIHQNTLTDWFFSYTF